MELKENLYQEDMAEKIHDMIANGESLRRISRKKGLPSLKVIRLWQRLYPSFQKLLADAYQQKRFYFIDMVMDLLLDVTPENLSCSKLKIDTLKWLIQSLENEGMSMEENKEGETLKDRLEQAYKRLQKVEKQGGE